MTETSPNAEPNANANANVNADARYNPADWLVEAPTAADHPTWDELYLGYCTFYDKPNADRDIVWRWINDPAHEIKAFVVRPATGGDAVGLAHYRPFARPLHGSVGCYLDDLFVAPTHRGSGAVYALMAKLREISRDRGWDVVRWITSETNVRAQTAYERVAVNTHYRTYDMSPTER